MKQEKDFVNNRQTLSHWMGGIAYELAFWNNVYRWNHTFQGTMGWSHYGQEIQLELFDANQFLSSRNTYKVLDVGCGMSYATGNHINDNGKLVPIDIHYVDPLADCFNQILKRHHRKLPEIEFGMMEYLSKFYPQQDIDLIIIQNALDHSANPMKGIVEAMNTLKKDGILYLNHHPNEAETEHYKGFHQYNITQEDGHLIIWNKNQRWDVNDYLKDFATTTISLHENGHVVAVIMKTENVTSDLLNDQQDIRGLAETIIDMSTDRSISNTFKFKMKYWTYNSIQFFTQALPWKAKMALKRAIKQA